MQTIWIKIQLSNIPVIVNILMVQQSCHNKRPRNSDLQKYSIQCDMQVYKCSFQNAINEILRETCM